MTKEKQCPQCDGWLIESNDVKGILWRKCKDCGTQFAENVKIDDSKIYDIVKGEE